MTEDWGGGGEGHQGLDLGGTYEKHCSREMLLGYIIMHWGQSTFVYYDCNQLIFTALLIVSGTFNDFRVMTYSRDCHTENHQPIIDPPPSS